MAERKRYPRLRTLKRGKIPTNSNQANIQPVYEVYASTQDRDLGGVSSEISKIVAERKAERIYVATKIPPTPEGDWPPAPYDRCEDRYPESYLRRCEADTTTG